MAADWIVLARFPASEAGPIELDTGGHYLLQLEDADPGQASMPGPLLFANAWGTIRQRDDGLEIRRVEQNGAAVEIEFIKRNSSPNGAQNFGNALVDLAYTFRPTNITLRQLTNPPADGSTPVTGGTAATNPPVPGTGGTTGFDPASLLPKVDIPWAGIFVGGAVLVTLSKVFGGR